MEFTSGYSDKDLQFFYVSNADFYDIWHVESWDLKLCHDIVRQREKVVNFRTNALFSRVILCAERHFRMNEIHWWSDIYLEKRV